MNFHSEHELYFALLYVAVSILLLIAALMGTFKTKASNTLLSAVCAMAADGRLGNVIRQGTYSLVLAGLFFAMDWKIMAVLVLSNALLSYGQGMLYKFKHKTQDKV